MEKINVAVIGVGYLGKFHAEKYASLPYINLVGIVDIDEMRVQEIAQHCNTTGYTDYKPLIGKVDAVSIVTPTALHFPIAKAFLENNAHVLLEKPITNTVEEADELITLANKHNLVLQVGHLERFNPAIISLQEILDQPLYIESRRIAPFKLRGTDVNVILDLMIHDIDIIQAIVDSPLEKIDAIGAPVLSDQNDVANARLQFKNGCVANVSASRVSLRSERKLHIFQHDAFIALDLQNKSLGIYRKGTGEMYPGIPEIVSQKKLYEKSDALYEEIVSFIDSVRNDSPVLVTGEDGKRALATAIKITNVIKDHAEIILS